MIRSSSVWSRALAPFRLSLAMAIGLTCACSPQDPDDDGIGGRGGGAEGGGSGGEGGLGGEGGQGGEGGDAGGQSGSPGGSGGSAVKDVMFGIQSRPANPTCLAPAKLPAEMGTAFPQSIKDTGCFDKADPRKPVPGVIPYDVLAPLWSDGAEKHRWMAVPDGAKIQVKEDGDFDYPVGSVLIKTFELDDVMLETRFMYRHGDGTWAGYTYVWNDEGTDATLSGEAAEFKFVGDLEWTFPSRENCLGCHQEAAGRTLGPEVAQLNGNFVYPGGMRANQLRTLEHLEMFDKPLGDLSAKDALVPLDREGDSAEARARAYMHTNCAHCHRPGGVTEVVMDLRYQTPLANTNICNVVPSKGVYGINGAKLITPGDPNLSIMPFRMMSLAQNVRMPSLGSAVRDDKGVEALNAWITSLKSCP